MVAKYRLKWSSYYKEDCLAIQWAHGNENYVAGDCYVRALQEGTDEYKYLKETLQPTYIKYTKLLTLEEIREFVAENKSFLGTQIHDCVGILIEDDPVDGPHEHDFQKYGSKKIDFAIPIEVRNHPKKVLTFSDTTPFKTTCCQLSFTGLNHSPLWEIKDSFQCRNCDCVHIHTEDEVLTKFYENARLKNEKM